MVAEFGLDEKKKLGRLSQGMKTRFALAVALSHGAELLLLEPLCHTLGGAPLLGRIALTALMVAPLGLFMGMPFPKGTCRVGELVDWAFAVNGAASVAGPSARSAPR